MYLTPPCVGVPSLSAVVPTGNTIELVPSTTTFPVPFGSRFILPFVFVLCISFKLVGSNFTFVSVLPPPDSGTPVLPV